MSSAIQKMFAMLLNNSTIFFWNTYLTGLLQNVIHWDLPNGHEMLDIIDVSSHFKLWYPELTSVSMRHVTPANWGKIFRIQLLWTGLISALLSLALCRHSLTLPFALWTNINLLHHSDVSSMASGTVICWFCSLSYSSFRCSYKAYATLLAVFIWLTAFFELQCKRFLWNSLCLKKHHWIHYEFCLLILCLLFYLPLCLQ